MIVIGVTLPLHITLGQAGAIQILTTTGTDRLDSFSENTSPIHCERMAVRKTPRARVDCRIAEALNSSTQPERLDHRQVDSEILLYRRSTL